MSDWLGECTGTLHSIPHPVNHQLKLLFCLTVFFVFVFGQVSLKAKIDSAEQGDVFAPYDLGLMFASGEHVEKNDSEAKKWLRLAAFQHLPEAQYELGQLYYLVEGKKRDLSSEFRWRLTG